MRTNQIAASMKRRFAAAIEREHRRVSREQVAQARRYAEPHSYIVTGLGMPVRMLPEGPDIGGSSQRACRRIGMELGRVRLTGRDFSGDPEDADRWTFRFQDGRRDDERAEVVADQLRCIESVNGMFWDMIHVVAIRDRIISKHGKVNIAQVLRGVASERPGLAAVAECRARLKMLTRRPADQDLFLWSSLPALREEKIERAVSFLHESHERAWFAYGQRWDMARFGPDCFNSPRAPSAAARLEGAVVAAFKAVEALVGTTQPRHVVRELIRNRYAQSMKVPYPPHSSLGEELTRLAEARDSRAAHGSGSRSGAVTIYELMGWQTCAQMLVNQALRRGNGVFADLVAILRAHSRGAGAPGASHGAH